MSLMTFAAVVATASVLQAGPKPAKEIAPPIHVPMSQAAWYLGAYGGGSFFQRDIIKKGAIPDSFAVKEKHKIGWAAGVKVGHDFDTAAPVRLALELDAMFTGFNRNITLPGAHLLTHVGHEPMTVKYNFQSFSLMANALAKFDCGQFQPYAGAGAGFHTTRMEEQVMGFKGHERGAGFAWQVLAGTDYKLDANWALFVEWKWVNYELPSKWTKGDAAFKSRISQQLASLGVRYSF